MPGGVMPFGVIGFSPPLTELFDNNGAAFRAAFLKLGNQCLDECLAQTGLMA